jgi:hypothetical protein
MATKAAAAIMIPAMRTLFFFMLVFPLSCWRCRLVLLVTARSLAHLDVTGFPRISPRPNNDISSGFPFRNIVKPLS